MKKNKKSKESTDNQLENVKTTDQCTEMATIDAYGDEEIASGWYECLGEIFSTVEYVKIFGEEVSFSGFDFFGNSLVAICSKNKKSTKVSLDSIEFIKPTKAQKLWIKAFLEYYN